MRLADPVVQVVTLLVQRDRADHPRCLPAVRFRAECDIAAAAQPLPHIPRMHPSADLDGRGLNVAVIDVLAFSEGQVAAPAGDLDVFNPFLRAHNAHRSRQRDAHRPAVDAVPDKIAFAHIISSRIRSSSAAVPQPSPPPVRPRPCRCSYTYSRRTGCCCSSGSEPPAPA